jgi:hypothetical protein
MTVVELSIVRLLKVWGFRMSILGGEERHSRARAMVMDRHTEWLWAKRHCCLRTSGVVHEQHVLSIEKTTSPMVPLWGCLEVVRATRSEQTGTTSARQSIQDRRRFALVHASDQPTLGRPAADVR